MARAIFRRMFRSLSTYHKEHSEREGKGLGAITAMRVTLEVARILGSCWVVSSRHVCIAQESDVASASYWESEADGLFK